MAILEMVKDVWKMRKKVKRVVKPCVGGMVSAAKLSGKRLKKSPVVLMLLRPGCWMSQEIFKEVQKEMAEFIILRSMSGAAICVFNVFRGFLELKEGTQRLPRLVGMSKVIDMMLTSKLIMSEEGKKLGLVDDAVSSEELLKVARRWALDIVEKRRPWISSLQRNDKLGSLSETREALKVARQHVIRTAPNMPQHQRCLDVIEEGVVFGGYSGIRKVCCC